MRRLLYKNYPPKLTREDYAEIVSLFCEENRHVKAIYLAGTFGDPGVSDLDLLVVDAEPRISPRVQESLVGGNVIVMPKDTMEMVNYLERLPLTKLYGPDIKIQENRCKEYDVVEIIEWLPERILLLELLTSQKEYDVRRLLLVLKSLDRSISNVEKHLQVEIPREDIRYTREHYMELDLEKSALRLLETARNAWEIFQSRVTPFTGDVLGRVAFPSHYRFENRFPLLMQYLRYLEGLENRFTCRLRRFLDLKGEVQCPSPALESLTHLRVSLLDRIYTWFLDHNLKRGMVKYGWILND